MSDNEDGGYSPKAADEEQLEDAPAAEEEQGEGEAEDEEELMEVEDSSEEDEDEEQNEYEEDGFIVNDAEDEEEVEEEGEEEEVQKQRKKKKKKREREHRLDDEDYDLLEENQVQGIRRPSARKRLKNKADVARKAVDAADFQKQLFGDEELEDELEDGGKEDRRERDSGGDDFDDLDQEDEMADFIVDGDEGAQGRRRARRRAAANIQGISGRAMQDAFDIFGDVDAVLDAFTAARARPAEAEAPEEAEDIEEDGDEGEDDDEAAEARRQARQERKRERVLKKAMKHLDPEQLERAHLMPQDQRIKDTDMPERMQEAQGQDLGQMDTEAAAAWILDRMRAANGPEWRILARGILEIDGSYDGGSGVVDCEEIMNGGGPGEVQLGSHRALLEQRGEEGMRKFVEDEARHGEVRKAIQQVLELFYSRHEEVPVVAMYRKELAGVLLCLRHEDLPNTTKADDPPSRLYQPGFIQPHHRRIRRWDVLWAVYEQSLRYRAFASRKQRALAHVRAAKDALLIKLGEAEPDNPQRAQWDFDYQGLEAGVAELEEARTQEGLADIQERINAVLAGYPDLMQSALELTHKRPMRGRNSTARNVFYQSLLEQFVITPAQFVANVQEAGQGMVNEPPTPAGGVSDWVTVAFAHPDQVAEEAASEDNEKQLQCVINSAVSNLVNDAAVRDLLRAEFSKHALVTCEATASGETQLDPFHRLGMAKRLRGKPVQSFHGSDLYLRLHTAHKDGLASLELKLDDQRKLLQDLTDMYKSSDRSQRANEWNEVRRLIIQQAVEAKLFPSYAKALQSRLLQDAHEAAIRRYADGVWGMASAPPLRLLNADTDEHLDGIRLCVVVYGNQQINPATGQPNNTAIAFLNELGNMVDFMYAGQLSGLISRSGQGAGAVFTDAKKARDAAKIREKLLEHLPHAVLVGMSNPNCRQLFDDIKNICESLLEHSADVLQDLETRAILHYPADERLASLWQNSAQARAEMPDHSPLIRRAVGLGRATLDPLGLMACLCGPDREVLSLQVYDMQDALSADERMQAVTRVMVTAVAQVGVDVNLACNVAWRSEVLKFVPGLGPRKAGALLQALLRNRNKVESRSFLYKEMGVMGKVVFRNAGPFLRVRQVPGLRHLENLAFRLLDNTRVSPEMYRQALNLAQAASGEAENERALEARDKIERFDLKTYLADNGITQPGLASFIDIVMELVAPAFELRGQWKEPEARQIFLWCSGETEETLRPGRMVDVTITFVLRDMLKAQLVGSGTEGIVPYERISSTNAVGRDQMSLLKGTTHMARVVEVVEQPDATGQQTRHVVQLTLRSDDLGDADCQWEACYLKSHEPFYVLAKDDRVKRKLDPHRTAQAEKDKLLMRPIHHPLFKNITANEANQQLAADDMPVGSCIFRPHSRREYASTRLQCSIKTFVGPVTKAFYIMAVELQEAAKPQSRAAHMQLGTPFTIDLSYMGCGTPSYEDFDQVLAEFVEPLVACCSTAGQHRKYMDASQQEVEARVRKDKQEQPGACHYYITIHKDNRFFIIFCSSQSVHKEPFLATPKGFYFRSRHYASLDKMLNVFKATPVDMAKRGTMPATGVQGPGVPQAMATGMQMGGRPQYGGYPAAASQQAYGYSQQQQQYGAYGGQQYNAPTQAAYGATQQAYGATQQASAQYGGAGLQGSQQQYGAYAGGQMGAMGAARGFAPPPPTWNTQQQQQQQQQQQWGR